MDQNNLNSNDLINKLIKEDNGSINLINKSINNESIFVNNDQLNEKLNENKELNKDLNSKDSESIESNIDENSIDSIEFVNENEISLDELSDKENSINTSNKIKITLGDDEQSSFNQNLSYLELDRSKTSIDDLSFSQKTLIKSCSLRSLVTDLINDEILLNKTELSSKELDEFEKEKFFQIIKIIKQDDNERKIEQLKELCITEKGLILSDLRRIVWPLITNSQHINPNNQPDKETIKNHSMYNQVIQDVNRTIKRFPPSIKEEERLSKEKQLTDLIMRILIENPNYYYYQGYHDICITFLLLLGEEKAFHVVNKVSQTHLSKFMEETMNSTQLLLEIIPILIEKEDYELNKFLTKVDVGTIFSLSWVLTWFSHILTNNRIVERLFDVFIASDYRLPIYLTASIILYNKDKIMKTEPDMAIVFQCLSNLLNDENQFPFELLLKQGLELLDKYPPDTLINEQKRRIKLQKIKEEELRKLFKIKQQKQLDNKQITILKTIKDNKVIIATTVLVAIGAISFQLYKNQS